MWEVFGQFTSPPTKSRELSYLFELNQSRPFIKSARIMQKNYGFFFRAENSSGNYIPQSPSLMIILSSIQQLSNRKQSNNNRNQHLLSTHNMTGTARRLTEILFHSTFNPRKQVSLPCLLAEISLFSTFSKIPAQTGKESHPESPTTQLKNLASDPCWLESQSKNLQNINQLIFVGYFRCNTAILLTLYIAIILKHGL